jgi:nucleoside phosphorylase
VRNKPECHLIDKLASGPFVIASTPFWDDHIAAGNRLVRAVEMEAAGVGAASRAWSKPLLVVRGISDFADERKSQLDAQGSGHWQKYAARNAAAMLQILLPMCFPLPSVYATGRSVPAHSTEPESVSDRPRTTGRPGDDPGNSPHAVAHSGFPADTRVEHANFGEGVVVRRFWEDGEAFLRVKFDDPDVGIVKKLREDLAPLRKLP